MTMAYAAARIAGTKVEYLSSTYTSSLTPGLYEGECIKHKYRPVAATCCVSFFGWQHSHFRHFLISCWYFSCHRCCCNIVRLSHCHISSKYFTFIMSMSLSPLVKRGTQKRGRKVSGCELVIYWLWSVSLLGPSTRDCSWALVTLVYDMILYKTSGGRWAGIARWPSSNIYQALLSHIKSHHTHSNKYVFDRYSSMSWYQSVCNIVQYCKQKNLSSPR